MAFYIYRRSWESAAGRGTAFVVEFRENDESRRRQFPTRAAAYAFAATLENSTIRGNGAEISFKELAEMYLSETKFNCLEVSTVNQYRSHVSAHLIPAFANTRLKQLSRDVIIAKTSELRERLSPVQAKNVFQTMRRIFRFALVRGHLKEDPSSGLRGGSTRKIGFLREGNMENNERKHRFLTKSELGILTTALGGVGPKGPLPLSNVIVFLNIALFAGLRASEIRGLFVADLNLDAQPATISVRRRADHQRNLGPLKTYSSSRIVPIPSRLAMLLRHWISKTILGPSDLVLSVRAKPINPHNFYNRDFFRFMNDVGLISVPPKTNGDEQCDHSRAADKYGSISLKPAFTLHSLRHTFASIQIEIGLDPKRIQARMGHSNILHTLNIYGHLWRDPARDLQEMDEISKKIEEISASVTGSDVEFLPKDDE
jgi:integrase